MAEFLKSQLDYILFLLWIGILTPHPDLSVLEEEVLPQAALDLVRLVWGPSWGKRIAGPPGLEFGAWSWLWSTSGWSF